MALSAISTPSDEAFKMGLAGKKAAEPPAACRPSLQSNAPRKPAVEAKTHLAGPEQEEPIKMKFMRHLRRLPSASGLIRLAGISKVLSRVPIFRQFLASMSGLQALKYSFCYPL